MMPSDQQTQQLSSQGQHYPLVPCNTLQLSTASSVMVDDDDNEVEREEVRHEININLEAKLKELLYKIQSTEIKVCSAATKEFIKLLKGESGGELLRIYIQASPKCLELLDAWKLQRGKAGVSCILSLVSAILSHPFGKYSMNDMGKISISRVLDKLARSFVEEYQEDVYKELSSQEIKRQNVVLLLMASIVRRGSGLASEVAKNFDFKLRAFSNIADFKKRIQKKVKHSLRKSFVGFAMSFLEVGKPGLLRWILQQREMYSGVLRGLGNDDDETVVYVLSTLKDRILIDESLVSPGLRSVLFGNATLEHLVNICGRDEGGSAAELAYNVLVMVCTDPVNGLMPDLKRRPIPFIGNPKRILGLMKKLKATEIAYHRDLLIAIVRGKPYLCSAYLEEFPYNLEDFGSLAWFAVISLAANLVSSVSTGLTFGFLDSQSHDLPSLNDADVQSIMKCLSVRQFSRTVINKGLLHSNILVKHGTLRLLLEVLKLLDSFIGSLHQVSCSNEQRMTRWSSLKQEIENEVRTLLPDGQILLALLYSLGRQSKTHVSGSKRKASLEFVPESGQNDLKKLKATTMSMDADIVLSRVTSTVIASQSDAERLVDTHSVNELDDENNLLNIIAEIWGLDLSDLPLVKMLDAETYFQSKLLDALKLYLRTMPNILEGSLEFSKLLKISLVLPTTLQSSILSLLIQFIGWSSSSAVPIRIPPAMYRHLHPLIDLLVFSPINDITDQAYCLAQASMLSTGAFDRNIHEVTAWFLFLPGYNQAKSVLELGAEPLHNLSVAVISFLCDAVSTVGNGLFKYWGTVKSYVDRLTGVKDKSLNFSPLFICVLQKCLRLLSSESETYTLPEKSMISLYVCNSLRYLLQTQVDARLLAALIESILAESFDEHRVADGNFGNIFCEWRPLKNLLLFSRGIVDQGNSCLSTRNRIALSADSSFASTLDEVKRLLRTGDGGEIVGVTKAFISSIICTSTDAVLKDFPSLMALSRNLGFPFSLLSYLFFSEENLLSGVSKMWPKIFFTGLEMALSNMRSGGSCGIHSNSSNTDEIIYNSDFDASEVSTACFSFFLKQAPFHVLFPAVMSIDGPSMFEPSKIEELLLLKLSVLKTNHLLISYLRLVLFWVHQIKSSYRIKPLRELEQLSQICFSLVDCLLTKLLALGTDSDSSRDIMISFSSISVQEVAETVFCHPAVVASLSYPLTSHEDFASGDIEGNLESFIMLNRQKLHTIDHHVLDILARTSVYLSSYKGKDSVVKAGDVRNKQLSEAFNGLVQILLQEFKNKYVLYIDTKDVIALLPAFCALQAVAHFISPFELLELVDWMFTTTNMDEYAVRRSCKSELSLGFCIAAGAFKNLSSYLWQSIQNNVPLELEGMNISVNLIEEIYIKTCLFAMHSESELADICLLEAVNTVYMQKSLESRSDEQISLVVSKLIMFTPVEILSHCIYDTSKTKARLLFILTELSSLHLSIFGHLLLGILNKCSCHRSKLTEDSAALSLSDEELLMLLPAALSYLVSIVIRFGNKPRDHHFESIPFLYSRILVNGFPHWECFVSGHLFEEEYGDLLPSSTQELIDLVNGSLLGKAVSMLRYDVAFHGNLVKMDSRLELFNSLFLESRVPGKLLDFDAREINSYSHNQSLNLLNKVVAKISLCRMLLFPGKWVLPEGSEMNFEEVPTDVQSHKEEQSRMRFFDILVSTWRSIVQFFPFLADTHEKKERTACSSLFRYLEIFILKTIFELTAEMCNCLIQLQSIPFLKQLMKVSLRYRFEDPTSLTIIRGILISLSEGKFSREPYLKLLLAHSQFASTIRSIAEPSSSRVGAFSRPMSSILRSLVMPSTNQGEQYTEATQVYMKQLEIVKLLRELLRSKVQPCGYTGNDSAVNFRELHSGLFSSYSATVRETDLVMYNLMQEIESIEASNTETMADMDFLWGNAALKIKKERDLEQDLFSVTNTDAELVKERRRNQFRENLLVDPNICVSTVLYFPHEKTRCDEPFYLNKLQPNGTDNIFERNCLGMGHVERYDPVFILRFAIHSLSMGYLEPVEFASLGLLAIAFVSLSSTEDGVRKMGYETLGKFKNAMEEGQKRKGIMRLRLLLTYVQNGIEEPWQRIPSVTALFAAEASFILLDPIHDHYATLSKHLMHSSRMNMKSIPLFHNFLWSSSINFKSERSWILRLVYAGLNVDHDAQMYIRNSIFEDLLSFYVSPLSDNESKTLILQAVKRSVKLQKMARYLIEQCGLLPWLSSVCSFCRGSLLGDEKSFFLKQFIVVLEIINDVISSRNISEWLQKYALEQLMELSSNLYKFLLNDVELIKEQSYLVNQILETTQLTLKISQKRKIYQPHFTLSIQGLFQMCQVINTFNYKNSSPMKELGLKSILMSTPQIALLHMDQEKLSSLVSWATSAAMESDLTKSRLSIESHVHITNISSEEHYEESLVSKLLRWLTASVILQRLSLKANGLDPNFWERSNLKTLNSLLEHVKTPHDGQVRTGSEKSLAASIFYLYQRLKMNHRLLPSVVSALCLLLFEDLISEGVLHSYGSHVSLLWSKIHCPAEANPSWRWSYYQPWKDLTLEMTELQKMEEVHACQTLLVIIANVLKEKPLDLQVLLFQNIEKLGVFEWEKSLVEDDNGLDSSI